MEKTKVFTEEAQVDGVYAQDFEKMCNFSKIVNGVDFEVKAIGGDITEDEVDFDVDFTNGWKYTDEIYVEDGEYVTHIQVVDNKGVERFSFKGECATGCGIYSDMLFALGKVK